MFEISVTSEFCATHALLISGVREPVHGHNFRVTATVAGDNLDPDGLLCDFHTVEHELGKILSRYHNKNLNETEPFDKLSPSAENLARRIAEELSLRLASSLGATARVQSVSVTEAPGCVATYRTGEPTLRPGP